MNSFLVRKGKSQRQWKKYIYHGQNYSKSTVENRVFLSVLFFIPIALWGGPQV